MKTQTLKQLLFSPEGRINRKKYILTLLSLNIFFGVVYAIISCCFISALLMAAGGAETPGTGGAIFSAIISVLIVVLGITAIYSAIVLNIKRFHDLNKSGWCSLLSLIPIINILVMLSLVFVKGTQGANQYGEDHLA